MTDEPKDTGEKHSQRPTETFGKKWANRGVVGAVVFVVSAGLSSVFLSDKDNPANGKTVSDSHQAVASREQLFKAHNLKPQQTKTSTSAPSVDKGDLQVGAAVVTGVAALGLALAAKRKIGQLKEALSEGMGLGNIWNQMTRKSETIHPPTAAQDAVKTATPPKGIKGPD